VARAHTRARRVDSPDRGRGYVQRHVQKGVALAGRTLVVNMLQCVRKMGYEHITARRSVHVGEHVTNNKCEATAVRLRRVFSVVCELPRARAPRPWKPCSTVPAVPSLHGRQDSACGGNGRLVRGQHIKVTLQAAYRQGREALLLGVRRGELHPERARKVWCAYSV
jgi:hypothetical protein